MAGGSSDAQRHRQLVAAAASLKAALRGLAAALSAPPCPAPVGQAGCEPEDRAAGAAARAAAAAAALRVLVGGRAAVGTEPAADPAAALQRLPSETARRLSEVNLPETLQALLVAAADAIARGLSAPVGADVASCGSGGCDGTSDDSDGGRRSARTSSSSGISSSSCDASSGGASEGAAKGEGGAAAAAPPKLLHPLWPQLQLAVADTCEGLGLLAVGSIRAANRAGGDPAPLLPQLAGAPLMAAAATLLSGLRRAMAAAEADGDAVAALPAARAAAGMSAAMLPLYGALATELSSDAGADSNSALQPLHDGLADGCRSTALHAEACGALLAAARPLAAAGPDAPGAIEEAQWCERAGGALLSLSMFLAGKAAASDSSDAGSDSEDDVWRDVDEAAAAVGCCSSEDPLSPGGATGRGCEDSPLGSAGRTPPRLPSALWNAAAGVCGGEDDGSTHGGNAAEVHAAGTVPLLATPEALGFLEERLFHAVQQMHGGPGATALAGGPMPALLPGRASSGQEGAPGAMLCVLHCWRALLRAGLRAARASLLDPHGRGPALLAAALSASGACAGGRPACSGSAQEALTAGCMVDAAELLLEAARSPEIATAADSDSASSAALQRLVPPAATAAACAAAAAAGAWEHQRRSVRAHCQELPHSAQMACAERGAADMLRLYERAAVAGAEAARVLLAAAQTSVLENPGLLPEPQGAPSPYFAAADAGLLPAMESLLRCVPPAAPVHASATALLAELLPPYASELQRISPAGDGERGALHERVAAVAGALTTLRKFAVRCAGGAGGPSGGTAATAAAAAGYCGGAADADAAAAVAAHMLSMLGGVLSAASDAGTDPAPESDLAAGLVALAASQLLPGAQALVTALARGPAGAPLASMLLSIAAQAAALHRRAPGLGLAAVMAAHRTLAAATAAVAVARAGRDCEGALDAALWLAEDTLGAAEEEGLALPRAVPRPSDPDSIAAGDTATTVAAAAPQSSPGGGAALLVALLESRLVSELYQVASASLQQQQPLKHADSWHGEAAGVFAARSLPLPVCPAGLSRTSSCCSGSFASASAAFFRGKVSSSATSLCTLGSTGALLGRKGTFASLGSPQDSPCILSAAASPAIGPRGSRVPLRQSSGATCASGAGDWAAVQAGRLDALLLRLAAASLAAWSAYGTAPAPQQHAAPRASGVDDAIATLRDTLAAAAARPLRQGSFGLAGGSSGDGSPLACPTAPLLGSMLSAASASPAAPPPLLLARADSAGDATPFGAISPSLSSDSCPTGTRRLIADAPVLLPPLGGSGGSVAAPLLAPSQAARLLRALSSAAPGIAKAVARASGASPLIDAAEALPGRVPALAALRFGCWSAHCASLAGRTDAAAPLKPCAGGCGAARFCSRACANSAYGAHRALCCDLASRVAAGAASGAAAGADAAADRGGSALLKPRTRSRRLGYY